MGLPVTPKQRHLKDRENMKAQPDAPPRGSVFWGQEERGVHHVTNIIWKIKQKLWESTIIFI